MADEQDLTATCDDGAWIVSDRDGHRWWPLHSAAAAIEASTDPASTAIRICRERPQRGTWTYPEVR